MVKEEDSRKIYSILQEILRRSNSELTRLRELEQRLDSMENRLAGLEETNNMRSKKSNEKFVYFDSSMHNINDEILRLKNSLEKINRQIGKFAKKREVREIEKMFELLSPLKQEFATKDDLEKIEEEVHSRE